MTDSYDVIVLGAGPTGENVADRAVRGGLTAAVVESELAGGECSYWACMPSKALLRPVAAVSEANAVNGVAGAALDPPEVLRRRDTFTNHWKDDGQVKWLEGVPADLYRGQGRLSGERRVTVGATELTARHAVVIATGSDAVVPPPLQDVNPWTSREATSAHAVPGRLAIVGGGVVGCEMATAWQALGAHVTLIARGGLLERLPGFAGDFVASGLRDAGVDVRVGASVTNASRGGVRGDAPPGSNTAAGDGTGPVTLTLDDGSVLVADEVLAAAGRAPRTRDIGLETVGLKPGSWLEVDDTLRVVGGGGGFVTGTDHGGSTSAGFGGVVPPGKQGDSPSAPWLYAVGDVNHLALLTHMGKYQARICGDAIAARAGGEEPTVTDRSSKNCVPQVIFTVPEVAAVGLTDEQARDAGIRTRVVTYDIGNVAGAALFADRAPSGRQPPQTPPTYGGYAGQAQMVVDEERKIIVGMTLAGPGVGEMIHAATIAVAGQVPLDVLWHAVPSFPTVSELWLRLLESYGL